MGKKTKTAFDLEVAGVDYGASDSYATLTIGDFTQEVVVRKSLDFSKDYSETMKTAGDALKRMSDRIMADAMFPMYSGPSTYKTHSKQEVRSIKEMKETLHHLISDIKHHGATNINLSECTNLHLARGPTDYGCLLRIEFSNGMYYDILFFASYMGNQDCLGMWKWIEHYAQHALGVDLKRQVQDVLSGRSRPKPYDHKWYDTPEPYYHGPDQIMLNPATKRWQKVMGQAVPNHDKLGWITAPDDYCDACLGNRVTTDPETKVEEVCWHCDGEGIDPTK